MKGRMGNAADSGRPSKKQKWGGDVIQVLMFYLSWVKKLPGLQKNDNKC